MDTSSELGTRLVDTLNRVHGAHPGHRAAHAKGSCCRATFTATPQAAGLTRAAHFQGRPVDAVVRFANGSGIPAYPDYAGSDGRGIAVKFRMPEGTHDMVGLTLPVFFARNPEDFMAFLEVTRPDPETRQPELARVGAFLEEHPETQATLGAAMSPALPASYLLTRYNGIHAFRLDAGDGTATWARYRWVPLAGGATISSEEARAGGREYLQEDLRRRLGNGPAVLRLEFILAAAGDSLVDPTQAWPAGRDVVAAGALTITGAEEAEACASMVFDPTNVVDGIACSEDPILHARSAAYARSFAVRQGISAPSPSIGEFAPDAGGRARAGATVTCPLPRQRLRCDDGEGAARAGAPACPHVGLKPPGGASHGADPAMLWSVGHAAHPRLQRSSRGRSVDEPSTDLRDRRPD